MEKLTESQMRKHKAIVNSLPYFCKNILKIKTKDSQIVPFAFNKEQQYAHDQIEDQKKRTGKVSKAAKEEKAAEERKASKKEK